MTSSSGRFGRASGGGEKMMSPSGKGQVATRGGWTRGGNGRGVGEKSNSLMDGQVAALGLQVFPQETPTVEPLGHSSQLHINPVFNSRVS